MVRSTKVTSREVSVDEGVVLAELQALHPDWAYMGTVGAMKLFKLVIIID